MTDNQQQPEPEERRSAWHEFWSVASVLAGALLLALVLVSFIFQSYQVDGVSMRQTLADGDHLIIWKAGKTLAKVRGQEFVPKRGEIIVFELPDVPATAGQGQKQLIKRVIALPGERVVFKGTSVTVYNDQNPEGFNPDQRGGYAAALVNNRPSNYQVTVPAGHVVVAGDNRDNSEDSRLFGPIDDDTITGTLVARVLPLGGFRTF